MIDIFSLMFLNVHVNSILTYCYSWWWGNDMSAKDSILDFVADYVYVFTFSACRSWVFKL